MSRSCTVKTRVVACFVISKNWVLVEATPTPVFTQIIAYKPIVLMDK